MNRILANGNVLPCSDPTIKEASDTGFPSKEAVLRELTLAEDLVNTFAVRARRYRKVWGPLGEPMMAAINAWADMQLLHLQWLREAVQATYGPGPRSRRSSSSSA